MQGGTRCKGLETVHIDDIGGAVFHPQSAVRADGDIDAVEPSVGVVGKHGEEAVMDVERACAGAFAEDPAGLEGDAAFNIYRSAVVAGSFADAHGGEGVVTGADAAGHSGVAGKCDLTITATADEYSAARLVAGLFEDDGGTVVELPGVLGAVVEEKVRACDRALVGIIRPIVGAGPEVGGVGGEDHVDILDVGCTCWNRGDRQQTCRGEEGKPLAQVHGVGSVVCWMRVVCQ